MPLDWASVHWAYVALFSGFAFIAALIGNVISLGHRLAGAILTAVCAQLQLGPAALGKFGEGYFGTLSRAIFRP